MKRTVIFLLMSIIAANIFVGCGKKEDCSFIGCDEPVYKDGLCNLHYLAEIEKQIIEYEDLLDR